MIFTDGKLLSSVSEEGRCLFIWTTYSEAINMGWYDTGSKDLDINVDGTYPHAISNLSSGAVYQMSYQEVVNYYEQLLKEKTNE